MATVIQADQGASVSWVEHQMLEHIKGALRVTLDWDAPAVSLERKKSSIRFSLQSFCRHLERLMSIEECDGYLDVVADEKPYLQDRVDRLAADHQAFRRRARELAPRLDEVSDWNEEEMDEVCLSIRHFLEDVDQHDLEEIRLLQETLTLDEGGEG